MGLMDGSPYTGAQPRFSTEEDVKALKQRVKKRHPTVNPRGPGGRFVSKRKSPVTKMRGRDEARD